MTLTSKQFPPIWCRSFPLGPRYLLQHFIFEMPSAFILLLMCETSFHTQVSLVLMHMVLTDNYTGREMHPGWAEPRVIKL